MATKTYIDVKQELDDLLLEDTPDNPPWTAARKQRALNRAIRSSWPNFKIAKENASAVTLAASTYRYNLTNAGITDIGDMGNGVGIVQVLVEPPTSAQDYVPLRTCTQSFDGASWYLHVPERIADGGYAGKKLELRYYARVPEFVAFDETDLIPAEFSNYVIYTAAVDLFGLYAQGGSDFNVEDLLKLIPLYTAKAVEEKKENTVYCMPVWVGVRSESCG